MHHKKRVHAVPSAALRGVLRCAPTCTPSLEWVGGLWGGVGECGEWGCEIRFFDTYVAEQRQGRDWARLGCGCPGVGWAFRRLWGFEKEGGGGEAPRPLQRAVNSKKVFHGAPPLRRREPDDGGSPLQNADSGARVNTTHAPDSFTEPHSLRNHPTSVCVHLRVPQSEKGLDPLAPASFTQPGPRHSPL